MNILIVYYSKYVYPLRSTIKDHLYSFQKYSGARCYYLNMAGLKVPKYILNTKFDLVVFHTLFLSKRWSRNFFPKLMQCSKALKTIGRVRIALPQDEFINTDLLCDFINDFAINHVFSVAPASEWKKIYSSVDFNKTLFHTVLTGYLDDTTLQRINQLALASKERPIDIGYRAWHAEAWLGRRGLLKTKIAQLFNEAAKTKSLKIDISTCDKDTFKGDDWFKFLLSCQYTIGVEGGASILDHDGTIREQTTAYLADHPEASFDQVEAACFPGRDGELSLFSLSPRHLEACATRTCQILVEGHYNGILIPGRHYIELKQDFSNLEQVIAKIESQEEWQQITERAYQEVVASGLFTYRGFVNTILGLVHEEDFYRIRSRFAYTGFTNWCYARLKDWFNWQLQACYGNAVNMIRRIAPSMFNRIYIFMRRLHKV